MNYWFDFNLVQELHRDRLAEAEKERLIQGLLTQRTSDSLYNSFLGWLSCWLFSVEEWLLDRDKK